MKMYAFLSFFLKSDSRLQYTIYTNICVHIVTQVFFSFQVTFIRKILIWRQLSSSCEISIQIRMFHRTLIFTLFYIVNINQHLLTLLAYNYHVNWENGESTVALETDLHVYFEYRRKMWVQRMCTILFAAKIILLDEANKEICEFLISQNKWSQPVPFHSSPFSLAPLIHFSCFLSRQISSIYLPIHQSIRNLLYIHVFATYLLLFVGIKHQKLTNQLI